MLQLLRNLFGYGPKTDWKELVHRGAVIIDVRSRGEYQGGHIKGSVNIPVQDLADNLSKLKKDKPVITCCASGMRSVSAKRILAAHGFAEVYNGGGWMALQNKIL